MADDQAYKLKVLKNRIRNVYFKMQYLGNQPLDVGGGTAYLKEKVVSSEPFMICRIGAEECRTALRWMRHLPYSQRNVHNIMFNAGVFPNDKHTIDKFCDEYTSALSVADGVFTWGCKGEASIIRRYAPKNAVMLRNAVNNFLFYDDVWTLALEGKQVLIVHPFTETIKKQYENRDKLFSTRKLPEFANIEYVTAIQSNAGESVSYDSWFEALDDMKTEILSKEFDIALIAAGAYGLPLAAYIKTLGKQAIHMASNLQILFGIRGRRWDNWPQWVPYFNEYWVYPSDDETPKGKQSVEGGSYWR